MSAHTDDVLQSIVEKVKNNIVTLLFALPAFGVMTGWLFKDLSELVELNYAIALRSFSVLYFSLPLLVLALSLLPIRNVRQNNSLIFRRYFKAGLICSFIIIHLLGTLSNQSFILDIVFIIEYMTVLGFLWKYHTTLRAVDETPIISILLVVALSIAFLGFPWNVFPSWNIFPIISIIGTITVLYLLLLHNRKPEFKNHYIISLYVAPTCVILLLIAILSLNLNNAFIAKAPDLPDGKEKIQLFQSGGTYDAVFQNYKDADSISKSYQWVTNCESDIWRLANLCNMKKELIAFKTATDSTTKSIVAEIERIQRKHDTISTNNIFKSVKGNEQLGEVFKTMLSDIDKREMLLKLRTIIAVLKEPAVFTTTEIKKAGVVPLSVLLAQIQWRGVFIFGLSCILLLFYRISKRKNHPEEKLQSIDASILILFLLLLPLFIPIKEETVNTKESYWFITLPNWYLPSTVANILNSSTTFRHSDTYVQKQDLEPVMRQLQDLQVLLDVNIDSVERLRGLVVENLDTAKNIQKLGIENLDTAKSVSKGIRSVQQTTDAVLNISDSILMSKNDALRFFNGITHLIATVNKSSHDNMPKKTDTIAEKYMDALQSGFFDTLNSYQKKYQWQKIEK